MFSIKKAFINFVLIFTLSVFSLVIFSSSVLAQYVVPKQISQLVVIKQIKHPQTGKFAGNLNSSEFVFLPNQEITFKIEVKNTGQTELKGVQVIDKLPSQLEFIQGVGSFDSGTNSVNFKIDTIKPQESKIFTIKTKVKSNSKSLICLTNFVEARVNDLIAQDVVSFCIEEKVLGVVEELPVTGSNSLRYSFLFGGLSLFFALYLLFRVITVLKGGEIRWKD